MDGEDLHFAPATRKHGPFDKAGSPKTRSWRSDLVLSRKSLCIVRMTDLRISNNALTCMSVIMNLGMSAYRKVDVLPPLTARHSRQELRRGRLGPPYIPGAFNSCPFFCCSILITDDKTTTSIDYIRVYQPSDKIK